ncbi:MAG: cysteine desulfurase family protein [bacterium]
MKYIYLDHSATTPVDADIVKSMLPYLSTKYGNASSIHYFGQEAMSAVETAKSACADFLNCKNDEVIFTNGATESNNLAIFGVIEALQRKNPDQKLHLITSVVEHDSVIEPMGKLRKMGVDVTFLGVKANGVVDIDEFKAAIKENTVLVSVMYVNSEVGAIQPIKEIGKIIHNHNGAKLRQWKKYSVNERGDKPQPIIFHTDATQAGNYLSCDVDHLYVDLLSLSAHKLYGPKGIGLLYVRYGTPIIAQQLGGHHQNNRRSGTLNTPGIVGLGRALKKITPKYREVQNKKISIIRDYLVTGILKTIPETILNTDRQVATPGHAHFSFLGVEGESILIALDMAGICVSTGSACASNSLKASHVLIAMGIKVEVAHGSLRITLGKYNTKAEMDMLIKTLPPIISNLRKINPLYKKST